LIKFNLETTNSPTLKELLILVLQWLLDQPVLSMDYSKTSLHNLIAQKSTPTPTLLSLLEELNMF